MLVLLVEDNRLLSNNIIQYLELSGIECDYAFNLAQADMLISSSSSMLSFLTLIYRTVMALKRVNAGKRNVLLHLSSC